MRLDRVARDAHNRCMLRSLIATAAFLITTAACTLLPLTPDPTPDAPKAHSALCTVDEVRAPGQLIACPRPGGD